MKRLCTILGLGLILAIADAGTLVVLLLDSQNPAAGDVPALILATIVWWLIVWSVLEVTVI